MIDLAVLSMQVDSTQVRQGVVELGKFGDAAATAEGKVGRLERSTDGATGAIGRMLTNIERIEQRMLRPLQAALSGVDAVGECILSMTASAARGLHNLATAIIDFRTLRSVFERDIDEPAKSAGDRLRDAAERAIVLHGATTGLEAAGASYAAGALVMAARLSLIAGATVTSVLRDSVQASRDAEQGLRAYQTTAARTYYAAGVTAPQAAATERDTALAVPTADRDDIRRGVQELLALRQLAAGTLTEVATVGTRLAVIFGGDVAQSMRALATAINDPVGGLRDLEAAGVSLTAADRARAAAAIEAGDAVAAGNIVLAEARRRVDELSAPTDDAAAAARRLAMTWDETATAIGNAVRWLGNLIYSSLIEPLRVGFYNALAGLASALDNFNATVAPTISNLERRIAENQQRLATLRGTAALQASVGMLEGAGGLDEQIHQIEQRIAADQQRIDELRASLPQLPQATAGPQRQAEIDQYNASLLESARDHGVAGAAVKDHRARNTELIASLEDELQATRLGARELEIAHAVRRLDAAATADETIQVRMLAGALYDEKRAREAARTVARAAEDVTLARTELSLLGASSAARAHVLALTRAQLDVEEQIREGRLTRGEADSIVASRVAAADLNEELRRTTEIFGDISSFAERQFFDLFSKAKTTWKSLIEDMRDMWARYMSRMAVQAFVTPKVAPIVTQKVKSS